MIKLQEGDIILFRKKDNLSSKIISMGTGSSYTHVGIVYSITESHIKTAEALAQGFTLVTYNTNSVNENIETDKWLIRRSIAPLINIRETILKYLGRPYGWLDLLCIAIYIITKKQIYKGSAKSLICSESGARFLYDSSSKQIDFEKEYSKPYSYITPDDIFMSTQLKTIK